MNHINKFNKSNYIDVQPSLIRKIDRRHSFDMNKNKNKLKTDSNSIKNKLRQIDKNKFKNIPKNESLMNFSTILFNNKNNDENRNSYKDKNDCPKMVSSIFINNNRFDLKRKTKDNNNLKISSLIPISKKRINKSKHKTIKEKEGVILNILKKDKKKVSKRKHSYNANDSKLSKNSKHTKITKKNREKYNSSHALIKVRKISNNNLVDILRNGIKEKKRKDKDEEKNSGNDDNNENNDIKKNVENKNENNVSEKKKNNQKKENTNKESPIIDINNAKTKNETEILKYTQKDKKKKYKKFPLCCLSINDDNSSDND